MHSWKAVINILKFKLTQNQIFVHRGGQKIVKMLKVFRVFLSCTFTVVRNNESKFGTVKNHFTHNLENGSGSTVGILKDNQLTC